MQFQATIAECANLIATTGDDEIRALALSVLNLVLRGEDQPRKPVRRRKAPP